MLEDIEGEIDSRIDELFDSAKRIFLQDTNVLILDKKSVIMCVILQKSLHMIETNNNIETLLINTTCRQMITRIYQLNNNKLNGLEKHRVFLSTLIHNSHYLLIMYIYVCNHFTNNFISIKTFYVILQLHLFFE
jgi:hypothetical protein